MPSKAFNNFHASCFGNSLSAVRDGLDIGALLALEGAERAEAARLVLEAIPTSGDDYRASMAAAYLSLPEAIPLVKTRLADTRARDDSRIWTAWSLYRLNRDPAAVALVLDILRVADPEQDFFRWNSGLIVVEWFDLTPPVLVALLELVIRVKPNYFLIRQCRKVFGHRYLDAFEAFREPGLEKPREQRALALQIWRDLPEATRQSLRSRLLAKLAATRSPEVAVVSGLLQLPEAAPVIRQIMATAKDGPAKVDCALALYQIDGAPEARAICLAVLRSDLSPGQRLCALEALLHMTPEPGSTTALLDTAEHDPDLYIRERSLAVLAELFHEDDTITSIRAAHMWPYDWPPGSQWQQPPAETMTALRAAVARALAAS